MKRLVISITALALCIAFSVFNTLYMRGISRDLLSLLEAAEEMYAAGKDDAEAEYGKFFDAFSGHETYLCISLNHSEIDILREAVAKTYAYIKADEAAEFYAEYFSLYRMIEHMGELESLSLENLL